MIKKHLIIIICLLFFFPAYAEEIFLSLKKNEVNVRSGPSFESPIKFIYKKKGLPIKQIDKKDNFRRIVDFKNNSGWIHISQLKKNSSIITLTDKILFKKPSDLSKPLAKIQKGKMMSLTKCIKDWCKVKSNKFNGWIKTADIWGL